MNANRGNGSPAAWFGGIARGSGSDPRRRVRAERGSSLVEFALIFMFFITVVLAIIDFSRALYVYHFLDHAAKSATRWAAVDGYTCAQDGSCTYGPTGSKTTNVQTYIADCGAVSTTTYSGCGAQQSDVQNYVKNLVPDGINSGNVTTTVTWPVQGASSDDPSPPICSGPVSGLSPSAIYNYPGCTVEVEVSYPFNFLFPLVHIGTVTMSSSSEMVIAH